MKGLEQVKGNRVWIIGRQHCIEQTGQAVKVGPE